MTSPLKPRLLRAIEFRNVESATLAAQLFGPTTKAREVVALMYGENARLRPLLLAMVECVGAVDEMCARYDDAVIRNKDASPLNKGMTIGVRHVFDKALSALQSLVEK